MDFQKTFSDSLKTLYIFKTKLILGFTAEMKLNEIASFSRSNGDDKTAVTI